MANLIGTKPNQVPTNGSLGTMAFIDYSVFYKEGTFTPTLVSATGTITLDSTQDLCSYVKVGRLVTIMGRIKVDSVSTPTGLLEIQGLPFTASDLGEVAEYSISSVAFENPVSSIDSPKMRTVANDTKAMISSYTGTGFSNIADKIQANTYLYFTHTYIAA